MLLHDKSSSIVQCLLWTCSRLHINYLLFSTPSRWNFAAAAPQWAKIFSEVILLFWWNYPFQSKFIFLKDRRNYVWSVIFSMQHRGGYGTSEGHKNGQKRILLIFLSQIRFIFNFVKKKNPEITAFWSISVPFWISIFTANVL